VDFVRGKARVIAVNDAVTLAPWADALYSYEVPWWDYYDGWPAFQGLKFSAAFPGNPDASRYGAHVLNLGDEQGLSLDRTVLNRGKHSGYQALNLAVHLGVNRILLLGYECQLGRDNREHYFGKHPKSIKKGQSFICWRRNYATMAGPLKVAGVDVINCSRQTALTAFPRIALEDALAQVPA
jgi:hypothetical protein